MKKAKIVFNKHAPFKDRYPINPIILSAQFVILFAFWLLLSGHYDAKHIVMGVLSACLVTLLTNDLFYSIFYPDDRCEVRGSEEKGGLLFIFLFCLRLLIYLLWLLYSIVISNLRVAYLVLHPRMPINPTLLYFGTGFQRDISKVTLANSIILTPGTVTIDLKVEDGGKYLVHVLEPRVAQRLLLGNMQNRVGAIFGERKEKAPHFLWTHYAPAQIWEKTSKQHF